MAIWTYATDKVGFGAWVTVKLTAKLPPPGGLVST